MIRVTCVCALSCRQIEVSESTSLDRILGKVKGLHCSSACGVMIRNHCVGDDIISEPVGRFAIDGDLRITRLCDPEPFVGSDGAVDETFQTYPCVNNTVFER